MQKTELEGMTDAQKHLDTTDKMVRVAGKFEPQFPDIEHKQDNTVQADPWEYEILRDQPDDAMLSEKPL